MTTIITYKQMQEAYEAFKKMLPSNAFERYSQELLHIRNLIKSAKIQGLTKDVFEYQKVEKEAVAKLQEMGYKIK